MNQRQIYGIIIGLGILALDQLSKHWLLGYVNSPGYSQEILPFFNLVMVWNRGISFGMLTGAGESSPFILIALTGLLCLGIACWLWVAATRYAAVALGLVLGGAIGNIIDRVRYGAVADFFDLHAFGHHWPAFNVADSAIVVGVAILVLESIFCKPKPSPSVQEPE